MKSEEEKQPPASSKQLAPIEALLLENEEMLAEVLIEAKYRKNKNVISPKMSLLINSIERNIIKIARLTTPESLADPGHVQKEKERFLRFYQKRNGAKKLSQSASKGKE
jgi:hypothetical protein